MKISGPGADEHIKLNVSVHNRVAKTYDKNHGEIFNDIEQKRLRQALERAVRLISTGAKSPVSLDYGCGSGNLTRHLMSLCSHVVAADVTPTFLKIVGERFPAERVSTLQLNGKDLSEIPTDTFDLVATYSVLHHIPDYISAIREFARVCKPGGVIYLDHEPTEAFWAGDPVFEEFRSKALMFDWRKYLVPSNYVAKARRLLNPKYTNEGDIHVWRDDHIEWPRIERALLEAGCVPIMHEKYLLNRRLYRSDVYEQYRGRCADMQLMAFRKN